MPNDTRRRSIGSVRQLSNGRWLARITRGRKADGERRNPSKVFDTKQESESWLQAMAVKLDERPDLGAGVTLSQLWSVYCHGKELSAKAWATYKWYAKRIWLERIGDMDVSQISPAVVQSVISTLTPGNARHAKVVLSSMLTYAVRIGVLNRNPIRGHDFDYPKRECDETTFDTDPFAAIQTARDVWDVRTTLRCYELIQGLPLEPAWLCCVGAGLRVEEALALRRMDVRRLQTSGHMVTQLAVHAARTSLDERKETKTKQSVRVVAMLEPFGARLWYIACGLENATDLLCTVSASNQNKRWRGYFQLPKVSKHLPKKDGFMHRGKLAELPYLPLSKMRNTHVTIMAESGVSDSINALMHGHTEMVERRHYLAPDTTQATFQASQQMHRRHLKLVG